MWCFSNFLSYNAIRFRSPRDRKAEKILRCHGNATVSSKHHRLFGAGVSVRERHLHSQHLGVHHHWGFGPSISRGGDRGTPHILDGSVLEPLHRHLHDCETREAQGTAQRLSVCHRHYRSCSHCGNCSVLRGDRDSRRVVLWEYRLRAARFLHGRRLPPLSATTVPGEPAGGNGIRPVLGHRKATAL